MFQKKKKSRDFNARCMLDWGVEGATCRSGSLVVCGWCWGQWGMPPQCSTEGSLAGLLVTQMPWPPLGTHTAFNKGRPPPPPSDQTLPVRELTQCKKLVDAVDDPLTFVVSYVLPPFSFLRLVKKSLHLFLCYFHTIADLFWQSSWWSSTIMSFS